MSCVTQTHTRDTDAEGPASLRPPSPSQHISAAVVMRVAILVHWGSITDLCHLLQEAQQKTSLSVVIHTLRNGERADGGAGEGPKVTVTTPPRGLTSF